MFRKAVQILTTTLLLLYFLPVGCGDQDTGISEGEKAKESTRDIEQEEDLLTPVSSKEQTESEKPQSKPIHDASIEAAENESTRDNSLVQVDWGHEISLDLMMTIARNDQIEEIQWHMLPNILRAQTFDGRIFHLKNENKGVDLRNTLINAGIKVGKGGVLFRHVF